MGDDENQARLDDIEDRIEHLREMIESCRKAMIASRAAISVGGVTFVANALGLIAPASLLLGLLSFTMIIGGIVWLGANKTSRELAVAALAQAQAEWRAATDAIEMSTIGE